jgi:hypothetical protein
MTSATKQKIQSNQAGCRKFGPTCGLVTTPEVGSSSTVGTLQTKYPHIQSSSQDKEQDVHLCTTMYHVALNLTSLQRWAPALPHILRPRTSPYY